MDALKKVDALTDAICTVGHARDNNALVNSPVYAKLDRTVDYLKKQQKQVVEEVCADPLQVTQ